MLLVVPGVILVGLAAGFAFAAYKIRRIRRFVAAATGTSIVESLADLRPDSGPVEVRGRVQPAPSGPLSSAYGGVPCVWHRHVVTRRAETGDEPEVVDEGRSDEPFAIVDRTGSVVVDPSGSDPFGTTKTVDRWEPDPTLRHEEWALLVDTPVAVRGEASERDGDLVIHRPSDESVFVIAAESRSGLAKAMDRAFRHRLPLCVAAALAGAAMIAVGLALR